MCQELSCLCSMILLARTHEESGNLWEVKRDDTKVCNKGYSLSRPHSRPLYSWFTHTFSGAGYSVSKPPANQRKALVPTVGKLITIRSKRRQSVSKRDQYTYGKQNKRSRQSGTIWWMGNQSYTSHPFITTWIPHNTDSEFNIGLIRQERF